MFVSFLLLYGAIYMFHYCFQKIKSISKIKQYISHISLNWYGYGYSYEKINIEEYPSRLILISSHTSMYDFIIGILYYYTMLHFRYDVYIFMKKQYQEICAPICSWIDPKIKFIAVDSNKNGLTKTVIQELKEKDHYVIYIAPEGTRNCTNNIRSGYWHIATALQIDIVYIGVDFVHKQITMEPYRSPSKTWKEEQELFIQSCKKYIPLYPERCYWTKQYYN